MSRVKVMIIRRSSGFTLLEMMIAMVIFALIGLASHSILSTVLDGNELSKKSVEQLHGMERAFFWMERDFLQVATRQVRVDGEAPSDKIFVGGELLNDSQGGAVSFTHDGWRNPGMILPRSEVQWVSYRMFDDNLERLYFNYPDPVTGEKPKTQILLKGIKSLSFEFYGSDGWDKNWDGTGLPTAVKVAIETDAIGKVERVFMLTDMVAPAKGQQPTGGIRR